MKHPEVLVLGAGGFLGTVVVDGSRVVGLPLGASYSVIIGLEVIGFCVAQWLALSVKFPSRSGAVVQNLGEVPAGQGSVA